MTSLTSKLSQLLYAIIGLILLVAVGFGLYIAGSGIFRAIVGLESDIAVAVIAAAATAFVSVVSIILGKLYEARLLVQKEHREKKVPVYEDLISFMLRVVLGGKTGNQPSEKDIQDFLAGFTQRIMVWGSDNVLSAWIKWRKIATDETCLKSNPMQIMILFEDLILAIRKDLGHKNQGLKQGDVLALFINDIDQHLPKKG